MNNLDWILRGLIHWNYPGLKVSHVRTAPEISKIRSATAALCNSSTMFVLGADEFTIYASVLGLVPCKNLEPMPTQRRANSFDDTGY